MEEETITIPIEEYNQNVLNVVLTIQKDTSV